MMKIMTLAPYKFLPAENGGQKAIEGLYSSLGKYSELSCISVRSNDLSKDHGFELLPLLGNSKLKYIDPLAVYSLARFIKRREITHLIIEHPYMGWLAVLLRKFTKVKIIVHSHNIEGERFKSMKKPWAPYLAKYEKSIHRTADLSLFITEEDRAYAIKNFGLSEKKTMTVPFAVELRNPPTREEKAKARTEVCIQHGIETNKKLLVFAGAFNYPPNALGLENLISRIAPALDQLGYPYHLIVCGKDIPDSISKTHPAVTFAGFVSDIHKYYRAADVFVNPITSGGGIKTKLVEALGNNCECVSTATGALGIPADMIENKMTVVQDHAWKEFAAAITRAEYTNDTPESFYRYFNADQIARNVIAAMQQLH